MIDNSPRPALLRVASPRACNTQQRAGSAQQPAQQAAPLPSLKALAVAALTRNNPCNNDATGPENPRNNDTVAGAGLLRDLTPAPLPRTAPIYRRLLALAPAAGLDEDQATYIVGVRVGILSEYQDCDDALLAEVLRAWALERPAMCATCGPVWLPQHWPRRVACCPWCASKRAGRPIPRPPFGP